MKWKGFGYDFNNNIVYELEKRKGYVKEYDFFGNIIFEGEYLNGMKMEKGKNIIIMVN